MEQFLFAYNPNKPEQGQFIYHEQYPRFRAKVINGDLIIDKEIEGPNVDYSGKLSRAKKWWLSFKRNYE